MILLITGISCVFPLLGWLPPRGVCCRRTVLASCVHDSVGIGTGWGWPDLLARDPEVFKPVHVILMTIRDTTRDSAEAAGDVLSLCKMVNILELSRMSPSSIRDVWDVVLMGFCACGGCYCSGGFFYVLCGAWDEGERESARTRAYTQGLVWVAVVMMIVVMFAPCGVAVGYQLPKSSWLWVDLSSGVEFEAPTTTGLPSTFDKDMVSARTDVACVEVIRLSMMAMWHPPCTDGRQRPQLAVRLFGPSRIDFLSFNIPFGELGPLKPSITMHAASGSHIAEQNLEHQTRPDSPGAMFCPGPEGFKT